MSMSITLGVVQYTPARAERGWNFETANLFLVEGATKYHWWNLPQEQQEWKTAQVSQEWYRSDEERGRTKGKS